MVGGHLDPGQAPVPDSAVRARAQAGRTATGWTDSGPMPSGRTPPETLSGRTGAAAGFVAGPGFDVDERRAADREPTGWTAGRPASGPSPLQAPADPRAADEAAGGRRSRGRAAVRDAPADHGADHDEVRPAGGRGGRSSRADRPERAERAGRPERMERPEPAERPQRRTGRRRGRRKIMIGAALAVVVAGAAAVVESGVFSSGPAHVLVTPDKLGTYVRRPQLEKQMNAAQLQKQVIAKSAGQASHVVSAVYEDGTSASSTAPPQMILFIGGNLSGVSASGFIASFTQQSKGAFVTSPGSLGGSAACVNAQASVPGSVALCTWADNDTFGVVASPTMTAARLATRLRAIRPMVEHLAR
jgi:hypothetical protein